MTTGMPPDKGNVSQGKAKKGPSILGGLMDFLILVLLVGGAGFGGYFYGTMQKMAPVNMVAPGTPGALQETDLNKPGKSSEADNKTSSAAKLSDENEKKTDTSSERKSNSEAKSVDDTKSASKKNQKSRYWISSSGTDYIGYSVTVSINGTPVDSFFGPDKTVNLSSKVKSGENTVTFDAKAMGDKYNKHKGDANAELILQLVSGPVVQEDFSSDDVIATFRCNASQDQDIKESANFVK